MNLSAIEPVSLHNATIKSSARQVATKKSSARQKATKKSSVRPMKMLLVEDSTLLREVLFETINNLKNISVVGMAATQTKAISLLKETQFDILLLDIELYDGSGFGVVKYTKQANYPFKTPILMLLTNHTTPQYLSLAKDLGVDYYFDKSMQFDLAIKAIELEAARFSKRLN